MSRLVKFASIGIVIAAGTIGGYFYLTADPIPDTFTCGVQSVCAVGRECTDVEPVAPLLVSDFSETGAFVQISAVGGTSAETTRASRPPLSPDENTFTGTSNNGSAVEFFYGHEIRRFKYIRSLDGTTTEIFGYCVTD